MIALIFLSCLSVPDKKKAQKSKIEIKADLPTFALPNPFTLRK
jgi:hypothetical protein